MKSIVFNKNCNFKGQDYIKGEKLTKFKKCDFTDIWRLNENGFIEPLTEEEFKEIINKKEKKQ